MTFWCNDTWFGFRRPAVVCRGSGPSWKPIWNVTAKFVVPGKLSEFCWSRNLLGNRGPCLPGGLTPQASKLHQIATLAGELDATQTRELQLVLQERSGNQSRMIPEYFGEVLRSQSPNRYFGESGPILPGMVDSSYGQQSQLDMSQKRRSGSHLHRYLILRSGRDVKVRSQGLQTM